MEEQTSLKTKIWTGRVMTSQLLNFLLKYQFKVTGNFLPFLFLLKKRKPCKNFIKTTSKSFWILSLQCIQQHCCVRTPTTGPGHPYCIYSTPCCGGRRIVHLQTHEILACLTFNKNTGFVMFLYSKDVTSSPLSRSISYSKLRLGDILTSFLFLTRSAVTACHNFDKQSVIIYLLY